MVLDTEGFRSAEFALMAPTCIAGMVLISFFVPLGNVAGAYTLSDAPAVPRADADVDEAHELRVRQATAAATWPLPFELIVFGISIAYFQEFEHFAHVWYPGYTLVVVITAMARRSTVIYQRHALEQFMAQFTANTLHNQLRCTILGNAVYSALCVLQQLRMPTCIVSATCNNSLHSSTMAQAQECAMTTKATSCALCEAIKQGTTCKIHQTMAIVCLTMWVPVWFALGRGAGFFRKWGKAQDMVADARERPFLAVAILTWIVGWVGVVR